MTEPWARGKDLSAFMIPIVQRLARYPILLRDLQKNTPPSHPEHALLEVAYAKVTSVAQTAEQGKGVTEDQERIMQLQRSIVNGFTFLDRGRRLLRATPILFRTKRPSPGTVWLFQDLVMVTKTCSEKTSRVLYDSDVVVFRFRYQWPTANSLSVDSSAKPSRKKKRATEVTFEFDNPVAEQEFFEELAAIQRELIRRKTSRWVRWGCPKLVNGLQPLVKPRVVSVVSQFFVFSERSDEIFRLQSGVLSVAGRFKFEPDFCVCAIADFAVLFSKKQFFRYSPIDEQVTPIQDTVPKRKGASIVAHGNDVVLFGGKSPAKKNKEYFNDVWILRGDFILGSNMENKPPPRWCHGATVVGHEMFVYGGSGPGGALGDVWVLHLVSMHWEKVGVQLPPRKRHSLFHFGYFIGIAGGSSPHFQLFEPKAKEVLGFEECGNVPEAAYSSVAVLGESVVLVAGTRNDKTKFCGIYEMEINVPDPKEPFRLLR
jgi:hypothetical protein